MYKHFVRPLLFKFSPEKVHHMVVDAVGVFSSVPGFGAILKSTYGFQHPDLEREIMGLHFPNPVGLAAGFDKDASFYSEFRNFGFGFIEIGTVTPKPQPGNPRPRSFRLPADKALINRMGFNNLGVDEAVKKLKNRDRRFIIGGNIGKNTLTPNSEAVGDYEYCFRRLYDYVDYFVVNVSCPNITDMAELQDQDMLMGILQRLMEIRAGKKVRKPVLLKISPDLNRKQIDETIKIVSNTGVDGFVATNTSIKREGLRTPSQEIQKIGNGGLSGLPLKERSTEIIAYLRKKAGQQVPIIGVGGIMNPEDALEKLNAGADLIQIYTGFIYEGPGLVKRILKRIISQ